MLLFILPFSFLISVAPYSLDQFNEDIYKAYISGDIELWERTLYKGAGSFSFDDYDAIYSLSLGFYGLIGNCISKEKHDQAEEYLEFVEKLVDKMLDKNSQSSRLNALRGALYAFRINLNSYKAMYLGPKSEKFIRKSIKLDNENPTAWVEFGNMMFYMPSMFGGNKQEGIKAYKTAIQLFEKQRDLSTCWLYLNTIVMLGQWHEELHMTTEAKKFYKKALEIEPNFKWVKSLSHSKTQTNN